MTQTLRFLVLFLVFLALPFTGLAKEKAYDSFLPLDLKAKFSDRVQDLVKLEEAKKNFFFQETKLNTGLSVEEIVAATANTKEGKTFKVVQAMTIESALETAGIKKDDKSFKYWRDVHKGETVVMIKNSDTWKPWFLLTCGNPVRVKGSSKEEPKTPPPAPPEVEKKTEQPAPPPQTVVGAPAPPAKKEKKCRKVIAPSQDIVTHSDTYIHSVIHRRICE